MAGKGKTGGGGGSTWGKLPDKTPNPINDSWSVIGSFVAGNKTYYQGQTAIVFGKNPPIPNPRATPTSSGGGYGRSSGGRGEAEPEDPAKPYRQWAHEHGYKPSASLIKLAVKGEWTLSQFARMARYRDTVQWMKGAAGKKEAREITAQYRQWFPTWKPTVGFLKGLYKYSRGMTLSTADIDEYIRTRPEFKDIYRYYDDWHSGYNVMSSPDTYRKYLDEFRNIYRTYMDELAPEEEIKFFFQSRGLTPEQFEGNIQRMRSTGDALQVWEGVQLNKDQTRAALYNRKGGEKYMNVLEQAAMKRAEYMKSEETTAAQKMDEFGRVKQLAI